VNVNTLEAQGIAAATTGEGIGLTSLLSSAALIVLFGAGFVATAGRTCRRPTSRSRAPRSLWWYAWR
jgi:hypothetical protein